MVERQGLVAKFWKSWTTTIEKNHQGEDNYKI